MPLQLLHGDQSVEQDLLEACSTADAVTESFE